MMRRATAGATLTRGAMLFPLLLGLAATGAAAQSSTPDMSNSVLIESLEQCRAIADDSARLQCFDREVGALVTATNEGEVRVVDSNDLKKARRGLFGFSLPKLGIFGGNNGDENLEALTSTVTRVQPLGNSEWYFWIEEGDAKWQIKRDPARNFAPKVGDAVELEKASLGTYWVRLNGRRAMRGVRVQ